jgi:Patatin-like phospholipase
MQDSPPRRKVALALQGGGSHGAYTWGVLDRLLEDRMLDIIGVTGTSAGAMNAVVLADGLLRGGPEGARQQLRVFGPRSGVMAGLSRLPQYPRFAVQGRRDACDKCGHERLQPDPSKPKDSRPTFIDKPAGPTDNSQRSARHR